MSRDPGLGVERAELAWQRTGLAYAATGVLLLRALPDAIPGHRTVVGIGFLAVGVTAMGFGVMRRWLAPRQAYRAVSLAMTALAAAAVAASWVG